MNKLMNALRIDAVMPALTQVLIPGWRCAIGSSTTMTLVLIEPGIFRPHSHQRGTRVEQEFPAALRTRSPSIEGPSAPPPVHADSSHNPFAIAGPICKTILDQVRMISGPRNSSTTK